MTPNPFLGVFLHWLGGLASGSFYVPFRAVRRWSWETYWLVGGFFSWIVMPWSMALLNTRNLMDVLRATPAGTLFWCALFGALWGFGNLTFGLTMRYLGMSLGMAVALGYCAAFGTLIPPLFQGEFHEKLIASTSGNVVLGGVLVCLLGIFIASRAGQTKEDEMPDHIKKAAITEFNFRRGIMVATVSGVLSACFAFGLAAGGPIKELTLQQGTGTIWQGLPVLVVVLIGGFSTNCAWCVILNVRNRTGYQYVKGEIRQQTPVSRLPAASGEGAPLEFTAIDGRTDKTPVPMARNYLFSAMAGITWYLQFFFYSMGETQMGRYKFSSWTLHMASIIIFSTLWGIALHEWRGASRKAWNLLRLAIFTLVLSTIIVGYGNYLGSQASH